MSVIFGIIVFLLQAVGVLVIAALIWVFIFKTICDSKKIDKQLQNEFKIKVEILPPNS